MVAGGRWGGLRVWRGRGTGLRGGCEGCGFVRGRGALDSVGEGFKGAEGVVERGGDGGGEVVGGASSGEEALHGAELGRAGVHDVVAGGAVDVDVEEGGGEDGLGADGGRRWRCRR